MEISVIIPAYNEGKNLPVIIDSLRNQTVKPKEIIVVDNNSKDDTYRVAKKIADKVHRCREQGISPARNFGAKNAKCGIIAFLDADSTVRPDWIETISENFSKDERIVAVSGLGAYDTKNLFKRLFSNSFTYSIFFGGKFLNSIGKHSIIANNLAIKKEVFDRLGGFDKIVVEDYYFSLKLRGLKDVRCVSDGKMKVIYSSRRLEKNGIIRTHYLWLKALLRKMPVEQYTLHDKL